MKQQRKNVIWMILLAACLFPAAGFSQFRVVGYLSLWAQGMPLVSDSVLKKLTHLDIAFVNPDSLGNLFLPVGVDALTDLAHTCKVKVLLSIGGGIFNPYYDSLLNNEHRQSFAEKLVKLAMDHHFDGIDADLEYDNINKNYESFIIALSVLLKKQGKLLTAALATRDAPRISNAALNRFDFINVMSYDQTGPWRPMEPGPHATYEKAVSDLYYWTNTRHLPKKKINLGLPFYGYGFGTTYGDRLSYGNIITAFPQAALQDTIMPNGGGAIYYNGLSTIQNKTRMALKNAGGVMIWQILQDAAGTQSLLTSIDAIVKAVPGKQ
jgi:chitinase